GTVVTVVEENRDDENYMPLQENLARLRKMKIGGRNIEIVTLPMPQKMVREGLQLPPSYANFYIANTCVLVPTFADPNDEAALSILGDCFPDRRIIGIDCRELIWGLGTFHCLTQQQPAMEQSVRANVIQIGRMVFARIERADHALILKIDFHVLHSRNLLQHRSQFAHALIAIFPFSRDFDHFLAGITAAPRKNGSAGSGVGRAGSMG